MRGEREDRHGRASEVSCMGCSRFLSRSLYNGDMDCPFGACGAPWSLQGRPGEAEHWPRRPKKGVAQNSGLMHPHRARNCSRIHAGAFRCDRAGVFPKSELWEHESRRIFGRPLPWTSRLFLWPPRRPRNGPLKNWPPAFPCDWSIAIFPPGRVPTFGRRTRAVGPQRRRCTPAVATRCPEPCQRFATPAGSRQRRRCASVLWREPCGVPRRSARG